MTALTKINYKLLSHFENQYSNNPAYMIVGEIPRGDCYALAPVVDYDSILLGLQGEIAAYHQDRRVGLLGEGEAYHLSIMTDDFLGLHNRSSKPARFLELIIKPSRDIRSAGHEAVHIDELKQEGHLRLIASGAGRDGSMSLHSDVDVYFGSLSKKEALVHEPQPMKRTLVHVVSGCVNVGDMRLRQFETAISSKEDARAGVMCRSPHAEILLIDAA